VKKRGQLDQKAWTILASREPLVVRPEGYEASGSPANFAELSRMVEKTSDFEHS